MTLVHLLPFSLQKVITLGNVASSDVTLLKCQAAKSAWRGDHLGCWRLQFYRLRLYSMILQMHGGHRIRFSI